MKGSYGWIHERTSIKCKKCGSYLRVHFRTVRRLGFQKGYACTNCWGTKKEILVQ